MCLNSMQTLSSMHVVIITISYRTIDTYTGISYKLKHDPNDVFEPAVNYLSDWSLSEIVLMMVMMMTWNIVPE